MRSILTACAVALFILFAAEVAKACDYNRNAVVVQTQAIVATPVVTVQPVVAQVVTPTVISQAVVVPTVQTVVAQPVIVQNVVQKQQVRRARLGGGGGGLGGAIDAVNNLVNSPAGQFALGAFVAKGFRFK